MDLNKIDKIVSTYIKDNKMAISTLDTVIPMCERVLTEKLDDYETNKWSRNFSVNDSIKIVSSYIKSIDDKMFQSFNEEIKNAEILPRDQFKYDAKIEIAVVSNVVKRDLIKNESDPIKKSVFFDELSDKKRIKQVEKEKDLSLNKSQRYVIAHVLVSEMLKHENVLDSFLKLHYEVENDNCKIRDVVENLLSRYPSLGGKNA